MPLTDRIRVLVVHGDAVSQAGLSAIFRTCPEFEIVNSDAASERAHFMHPSPARWQADVVVADYEQGVEFAAQIASYPASAVSCKVMIVATSDRECDIRHALECGVRGYLLVGCALTELAAAVRTVHRGLRHLSAGVAQRLAESMSGESLTPRENAVLRLIVDGLGNKAIAKQLDIAVGTVKSHVKGVFSKLNVESRTQAVAASERRGLLGVGHNSGQSAADHGRPLNAAPVNGAVFAHGRRFAETGMAARRTPQNQSVACMH